MTAMNFVEVMTQVKSFFSAFNILGNGIVIIWIIGSVFLARAISQKKDEFVLFIMILLGSGGILIFADSPVKYVILVVDVLVVIFGMFRMLYRRKEESE